MPGSRLGWQYLDKIAADLNIRILTFDRPGYGHSTFVKNLSHSDIAYDLEELLDHFGIRKFSIIGTSGGGPTALVCANHFGKDRLKGTGVMCGTAPPEAGRKDESWGKTYRSYMWAHFPRFFATRMYKNMAEHLLEAENYVREVELRNLSSTKEHKEAYWKHITYIEERRQGHKGYSGDVRRIRSSWGFKLADIESNCIGTQDPRPSPSMHHVQS
jgi:pimeloyl-ACP methyl ester carboxylesterase